MEPEIKNFFYDLSSTDDKLRMSAFQAVLDLTSNKVDWVYDVWDEMIDKLSHENSFQRSIGIIILCSLAKSDHENRMAGILDSLLSHTKDEKFITSRQCLQNIWKVAAANEQNREKVIGHLEKRYLECRPENHYNLLRLDAIQSIKNTFDQTGDQTLMDRAWDLIAQETEAGYRKKYETVLKSKT
jgi:hypothetical protein